MIRRVGSKLYIDMNDEDKWLIVNNTALALNANESIRLHLKMFIDHHQIKTKYGYTGSMEWDISDAFTFLLNETGRIQTELTMINADDISIALEMLSDKDRIEHIEKCCKEADGNADKYRELYVHTSII